MSGHSFCKPVIRVDRVPTPLPSDDTPTPSGGRFGNLRAKREAVVESPPADRSTVGSMDKPSTSRFANLKANQSATSLASLVDSPAEENRFNRLRSRPSEGSFPIEEITEGRVFGSLKASNSCPNMDENTEPSRFSASLRTNSYGSAFDMQRDRKPSREETKRLVVNESSNFILKKIAERQRKEDEPSPTVIPRCMRNALAEMVMIAQNTVESPISPPKPKEKAKPKKKNAVSLDDLDDDMPVAINAAKISQQYGQIEASENEEDEDDTNGMSAKELKKLRRLEKVEARGGAKNHYI
jgi:hypothetical protein